MKKYSFIGVIIFLVINVVMCQEIKKEDVPAIIISAFQQKFPNAKHVEWEMENSEFEVNFKMDKMEWSAKYNKSGALLETEFEIKVSELPENVKQAVEAQFPDFKIDEAEMVTLANKAIVYEIEVEKGEKSYEVQVSTEGKILKQTEETEKDD